MIVKTAFEKYDNDIQELVKSFEMMGDTGNYSLFVDGGWRSDDEFNVTVTGDAFGNFIKVYSFKVTDTDRLYEGGSLSLAADAVAKRLEKRYLKIALYRTMSFLTGINLPYGALTGIRPSKLYTELKGTGLVDDIFSKDFSVSPDKLSLIKKIAENQEKSRPESDKCVNVFINIPFCPTRCAYCSFISATTAKYADKLEYYKDCLIKELALLKTIVDENNFVVRSVYVGGGTPTSFSTPLLSEILATAADFNPREFTVEAGRPDTLNAQKVKALKAAGVTRVSVNPQTFNDKTLETIGRAHSAEDTVKAFKLTRKHFITNMDLIAMLPGEDFSDFKYSLDKAVSLAPDNITVHMLSMKKGSVLKLSDYKVENSALASQMIDYAAEALRVAGYNPYYMYRQKYAGGSLENTGYARHGKECVYNIDIMEERTSILAAGAGAISKKLIPAENRIERQADFKGIDDYLNRFEEVLERTRSLWKKS
ncbi:MAG: coproporphyrinogen dehydrogenase HemZ [Clostridiaceae bacterium]|jgi:oxygen-independent coproporphyrinogen-3 oxidase|nr:coproporphyrinogen dehydrogenase HemZ [Clostridiaceae bacterium]